MELYDYQVEAVNSTDTEYKGIIVMPTGTGKTMVQSAIIERDIQNNPNSFLVEVVIAPRILLTYQLLNEGYNYNVNKGIECRYHFVHSGTAIDERDLEFMRIQANLDGGNIPFSEIESSTSIGRLCEVIEKAKETNVPLIIFSTYNSAEKIELALKKSDTKINIVLNDEAHYLVQERFHNIINTLTSDRSYYFTATTRNTSSEVGRGMNNVNAYGEIIYKLLPRVAIDMGMMVRPRIHTIKTDGVKSSEDYDRSLNLVILNSFKQHKTHLNEHHPLVSTKILVSTRGAEDIKEFLASKEYEALRSNNVDVFAISSNQEIGNVVNGVNVKRQEFLKLLRQYGKDMNREMLVLHFDILTEGIDVPGITSIMPLRELNKSRFIQTFGRCARLDVRDRERLTSGEINANDLDKMVKPYAYVILPYLTQTNADDSERMKNMVRDLRLYTFDPSEDVIGEFKAIGIGEEEELDVFSKPDRNNMTTGQIIAEMISEFENEDIANLSALDYMDMHIQNEVAIPRKRKTKEELLEYKRRYAKKYYAIEKNKEARKQYAKEYRKKSKKGLVD
jgi:superfamily II DNA or RNA helicase